jgi:hypothetical protein
LRRLQNEWAWVYRRAVDSSEKLVHSGYDGDLGTFARVSPKVTTDVIIFMDYATGQKVRHQRWRSRSDATGILLNRRFKVVTE